MRIRTAVLALLTMLPCGCGSRIPPPAAAQESAGLLTRGVEVYGGLDVTDAVVEAEGTILLSGQIRESGGTLDGEDLQGVAFFGRIDPAGRRRWSLEVDQGLSVARLIALPSGDFVVSGAFTSGSTVFGEIADRGGYSGLVARLAPNGRTRWTRSVGPTHSYGAFSAVDVVGNVYSTVWLAADPSADIPHGDWGRPWVGTLLSKRSPDGALLWSVDLGSMFPYGVVTDLEGAVWICGMTVDPQGGQRFGALVVRVDAQGRVLLRRELAREVGWQTEAVAIALDETSGEVVVVGAGPGALQAPQWQDRPFLVRVSPDGGATVTPLPMAEDEAQAHPVALCSRQDGVVVASLHQLGTDRARAGARLEPQIELTVLDRRGAVLRNHSFVTIGHAEVNALRCLADGEVLLGGALTSIDFGSGPVLASHHLGAGFVAWLRP